MVAVVVVLGMPAVADYLAAQAAALKVRVALDLVQQVKDLLAEVERVALSTALVVAVAQVQQVQMGQVVSEVMVGQVNPLQYQAHQSLTLAVAVAEFTRNLALMVLVALAVVVVVLQLPVLLAQLILVAVVVVIEELPPQRLTLAEQVAQASL